MTMNIHVGDALSVLRTMPDASAHCCVTSPPYYGLRDYGVDGQIGLEATPAEYVARLVDVFREVRRVLRDDGTLWLNIGDSYAGQAGGFQGQHGLRRDRAYTCSRIMHKRGAPRKSLLAIPCRLTIAMLEDGWLLRQRIVWNKPNPIPEPVRDRCTSAHEDVLMFARRPRYYFDHAANQEAATGRSTGQDEGTDYIREFLADHNITHKHADAAAKEAAAGNHRNRTKLGLRDVGGRETRNRRSVWTISMEPCQEEHFAVMPSELARRCVELGCPAGGVVLDPFGGAGTTGLVAARLNRRAVLIELNPKYVEIARRRIAREAQQGCLFDNAAREAEEVTR